MKVLAIDIGGTNVKILATGQTESRKFPSGRKLTPRKMVAQVKKLAGDWKYDVVSIGYPGRVVDDRATTEPRNLAPRLGRVRFCQARSGAASRSSTMRRCRRSGATTAERCCSSASGPASASALMVADTSCRWSSAPSPTGTGTFEDYVGRRGAREAREEEVAEGRRGPHRAVGVRASPRRSRDRRRKRQEAEEVAAGLPRSAPTPTRSLAGSACGNPAKHARHTVPNGPAMTGQRKRKERADDRDHDEHEPSLTARAAWKALAAHHQQIQDVHLRTLFAARSQARRAPDGRGRGRLSRLLEEPHHRRDAAAPVQLAEECRPARAHRRHVRRRQDQHHREPRGAARRAAGAARRLDRRRRRERRARGARRAGQDGRLLQPRPQRRVEGPHRQAHPQRRQHRHRRLRPRPGDGVRGAQASTATGR